MIEATKALLWLLMVSGLAAPLNAAIVDLVILAGQSNMVGQANTTATIPGTNPADSLVPFYYDVTNTDASFADTSGQTFGNLKPWRFNASSNRFGPEISLGRDLVNLAGLNPALIKIAIGGSDIARWLPPTPVDYTKLVNAVSDGIIELQLAGHTVNLMGMVWLQGESDVISSVRADAYASNLSNFVHSFRSHMDANFPVLGFHALHVYLVEPANWKNGSSPGSATNANIAKVHGALEEFAVNDPHATYIFTADFTQFEDNLIHFSEADQLALGSRIAAAIQQNQVPEPTYLSIVGCMMAGLVILRRTNLSLASQLDL